MKQALLAFAMLIASNFAGAEPCKIGEGADQALLKCYETEFKERFSTNETRHKDLVNRAKDLLHEAAQNEQPKQVTAYSELIRKINHSVTGSRRTAASTCVRMASKFQSKDDSDVSSVASYNCKTEYEVKLDKELRHFKFQLQLLSGAKDT